MVKNSNSKGCTVGCLFDKYVKENYFPAFGIHHLTLLRGTLSDDRIRTDFMDSLNLSDDSPIKSWEDMETFIDSINIKISNNQEITEEDKNVMQQYAQALTSFMQEANMRDVIKEKVQLMAGSKSTKSQAYSVFKQKIPSQYRREVLMQVVAGVIGRLDYLESQAFYNNFTRQEILNYEVPNKGPMIGVILTSVRSSIANQYQKLKAKSILLNNDKIQIFESLLNDADTWASVIDMAKDLLLDAEHLKLDTNHSYAFDVEEEDLEIPNPEDEAPQSAEEVGPEHWQLKSDTISSFNSMTREVRSLLYKLPDRKVGILGFANVVDVMLIHQDLLSLRAERYCTNSDEFIQAIKKTSTSWSAKLVDILEKDPYKRSIVFNTYKKNHLYYVYHNRKTEFLENIGNVTKFYRNKSGNNSQVLLNYYVGGITDIDRNNKVCIFDNNSLIKGTNLKIFLNILFGKSSFDNFSFYNKNERVFNAEFYNLKGRDPIKLSDQEKAENKRSFILYINDALNLHLSHEDIDILMTNNRDFKSFCFNLFKIADAARKTGDNLRNIESLLSNTTKINYFKRLLKSSKHTLTIQDRTSPIEPTFRYNKGSYVAHTIPNAIGDTLERIGKYASQGREALRDYLEKTYLDCPIYATKITNNGVTTYTIHNEWLNRLYNVSKEDLNNPASWVNQFINNLTRGLGTKDREFKNFIEKDNYLFTLNEFMQTYADSNKKLGVVPMFVTGDSNATRYITTPILSSPEIMTKMVDVAFQEIERMNMFQGVLNWCDTNGYALSNGHEGTKKGDKYYDNNPLVKNANRFTFLPFLNDNTTWVNPSTGERYSTWREAYNKIGASDPTRTAFRQMLKEKIEVALDAKYDEFKEELIKSGIAIPDYSDVVVDRESIYVEGTEADVNSGFLKNFYLNTKFNLIQQLQMMTVDPGFYNSTEDMQKRYKEMIASGETLDKTAIDPDTGKPVDNNHGHQRVWYFNEIIRNGETASPEFMDAIAGNLSNGAYAVYTAAKAGENVKKLEAYAEANRGTQNWTSMDEDILSNLKKYTKNTLTDGQGYRSFTSYRKLMIMRGLWSKEAEKVYRIIVNNRKAHAEKIEKGEAAKGSLPRLSIDDLRKIDRMGVVFQPLKPFYFGLERLETANGIALIPVQHKYSEFPIIPELLPANSKLGALGWAMETNKDEDGNLAPIDLATCTTTVKVGGFGSFDIDNCNTAEDIINSSRTGYTHELDLDGWRQQSNVPEHTDTSRARGTQWAKHGYGCLADSQPKAYRFLQRFKNGIIRLTRNNSIHLNDGKIDQLSMVKLYGALGSAGFIKSSIALTNRLSSPESCSEALSQMRANDSRGSNDDISAYELDGDGEFNLSPCEGIMAADNMASLLSLLRKEVIKQRMKGGSCVQVSAYGMDDILKVHTAKTSDGKTNIVYADCARTFDYSITTSEGKLIKLDYFDFVDPETGMLLDENGKPVEPADADDEHEFYGWNTKMGKMYPGILDMIAYRIPTEKDYSIINLKARRFFPKTTGGIMMVPSQFTTIAGFDFDIDKLYFVQREFKYSSPTVIYNNYNIWTDFYTESPLGKKIFPYLKRAYEQNVKLAPGYSELGKTLMAEYNKQWDNARRLMTDEGVDMSDVPATYTDAFLQFAYTHTDRYGNLKYIILKSGYNYDSPILEQSQEAVNNLLFDYYQSRLEDYDTFKERYTPGGPIQLKKALPIMLAIRYASSKELAQCRTLKDLERLSEKFKDYSHPYDPTELSTVAHYQTYNAIYDKLIAVAANQNINQRLTALLERLSLKEATKFGSLTQCSTTDTDAGRNVKARIINGIDTELLNTELLSSSVDAVKNAILEYFGIDDNNFNAVCLLSKIGASPVDIGLLLNQPVVKKAMDIMKESNISKSISAALDEALQSNDFSGNNYENDSKISREFDGTDTKNNKIRDSYVTSDKLVEYIAICNSVGEPSENMGYLKGQYAVAHLLKEIVTAASELSDQVSISKSTSVSSVPSGLGAIENTEMKIINFITKFGSKESKFDVEVLSSTNSDTREFIRTIIDPFLRFSDIGTAEDVLDKCAASPYCMEQVAYSSIMNFVDNVIGAIFPYRTNGFKTLKTSLAALTLRGYLSADLCDMVDKDAMMFLIERMTDVFNDNKPVTILNPNGNEVKRNIPQKLFYKEMFPAYFEAVMANNKNALANGLATVDYSQIPLLAALSKEAEGYTKGKRSSITGEYNQVLKFAGIGGLKGYQKDILKESWEAMYASEDPVLKNMAKHLFLYSYYSRGFNFGDTSVMSLAPVQLKKDLFGGEYALFFNRVFNLSATEGGSSLQENGLGESLSSGISVKDFLKAFILNHSSEYQFTKVLNKNQKSKLKAITPGGMTDMNKEVSDETFIKKCQSFTINFNNDNELNSSLKTLGTILKNDKGEIIGCKFTPCVKIGDALYICDTDLSSNNPNFVTSESKSITYYRMDLPMGLDYSKPQRYGTRDTTIMEHSKDNAELVQAIREMCISYQQSLQPTVPEVGDDNSHGGEIQYSNINDAVNIVLQNMQNLVSLFQSFADGAQFWHVQEDFIRSLQQTLGIIRDSLDTAIYIETDTGRQLQILNELLQSPLLSNPMQLYIQDLENALSDGVVVFDLETTHAQDSDARDKERCGIAQIGAFAIKDGQIVPNSIINTFVTPQEGHNTDPIWTNKYTGEDRVNPIHNAYQQAIAAGTTMNEVEALTRISILLAQYQRGLGFNSIYFDSKVLDRRFKATQRVRNERLQTVRHFDAMTIARLALEDRGMPRWPSGKPNLTRESVVKWLTLNKPEFTQEVESLRQQLSATGAQSHDAVNDIIEEYCIAKHLMPELKTTNVVRNTAEYKILVQSLYNIKSIIENQQRIQKQQQNQNPSLNEQADNAPNQGNVCD